MKNILHPHPILIFLVLLTLIILIGCKDLFHSPESKEGYEIGDKGPAGGIVFYDAGTIINGWRYLEASPTIFSAQWGAYGVDIKGTGLSIGDGKQNTLIIVAALNELGETGRAAQICDNLNINGYDDWFLPSRDELEEMYNRRRVLEMSYGEFWSSSQSSIEHTWFQRFSGGTYAQSEGKDEIRSVRAIRAF